MNEKSLKNAITRLLWEAYETSLPDTPFRMATIIVERLKQMGYLEEGQ
jgi:hypothetical protein